MTDNVTPFVRKADPLAPDAYVLEALEHLLVEAKAGRLRGVAYMGVLDGRQVASGWAGEAVDDNVFVVLGSLAALQQRFIISKKLAVPS